MIYSGRGWRKTGTCEALHCVQGMEQWRYCPGTKHLDLIMLQIPWKGTAAMQPHVPAQGQSRTGVAAWAGVMACAAGARCHTGRRR